MKGFFSWLWNGFGLGNSSLALRAFGMTCAFLLSGVYILYLLIHAIVRAVNSSRQQSRRE